MSKSPDDHESNDPDAGSGARPDGNDAADSVNPYQAPDGKSGTEPELSSGEPKKAAMAFIMLTIFIDMLGIGIIIPVLPQLVKNFVGGDASQAGLYYGIIGATYSFMQFVFAPIVGALSDRFGRRPVILASLFGLGIDFLIQGFAPNIGWLFFGRVLAGVMGASFSSANAYIADISTVETRGRNYGLAGMMFGLGFIFGPALGGFLGGINLRLPFFVSAGLALLNWLYGYFVLPESLPVNKRSRFSLAKANPFGSIKLLRQYPIVAGMAVAFAFMSLAQRGLENVWVLYTDYRFGWTQTDNGWALCLVGVTAAIVQGGMVRPFIKRFGEARTILIGLSVATIAFLGYGLATAGWMMPIIIVFGSLAGVSQPALQSIVAGSVGPTNQGKVQGALTSLMSLTNIVAPLLFAAGLFSYFTSDSAPFELPGAPFLLGSALMLIALIVSQIVLNRFGSLKNVEEATAVE